MSSTGFPLQPQKHSLRTDQPPRTVVGTEDARVHLADIAADQAAVGQVPMFNGVYWASADVSGTGSVTSVGLTMPKEFGIVGSPVTAAGSFTVTWLNEGQNTFLAGPSSGGSGTPGFRVISPDDILAATTGAPSDTPAERTARFDTAAHKLYVYDGAAWKSVTLT